MTVCQCLQFLSAPGVFDPLLAAIFSQGKSFPVMHRLMCICSAGLGHKPAQLTLVQYEFLPWLVSWVVLLVQVRSATEPPHLHLQFAVGSSRLLQQPLLWGRHRLFYSAFVMQCALSTVFCSIGSSQPWRRHGTFNLSSWHPYPAFLQDWGWGSPGPQISAVFQGPLLWPAPLQ